MPVFNANNADPDQTPRSVASELGLHSLAIYVLYDARFKWLINLLMYSKGCIVPLVPISLALAVSVWGICHEPVSLFY